MNTPCVYKQEAKNSLYSTADSPSGFLLHYSRMPRGPGSRNSERCAVFQAFARAVPSIYNAIPIFTTCPVLKHPPRHTSRHFFYEGLPHPRVVTHPLFTTLEPMEKSTPVPRGFAYLFASPPMTISLLTAWPVPLSKPSKTTKQDLSLLNLYPGLYAPLSFSKQPAKQSILISQKER